MAVEGHSVPTINGVPSPQFMSSYRSVGDSVAKRFARSPGRTNAFPDQESAVVSISDFRSNSRRENKEAALQPNEVQPANKPTGSAPKDRDCQPTYPAASRLVRATESVPVTRRTWNAKKPKSYGRLGSSIPACNATWDRLQSRDFSVFSGAKYKSFRTGPLAEPA